MEMMKQLFMPTLNNIVQVNYTLATRGSIVDTGRSSNPGKYCTDNGTIVQCTSRGHLATLAKLCVEDILATPVHIVRVKEILVNLGSIAQI